MADLEQFMAGLRASQGGGGLYQTFDRRFCSGTRTTATGIMELSAIWLPGGLSVTNVNFWSVGGVTTNTNNWAALYRADLTLIAQSTTDASGTDYAANTKIVKALASGPYTLPYSGLYFLAWMQAASTPNTMLSSPTITASSVVCNDSPILWGTSTTGLTTTAPATAAAVTNAGAISQLYGTVS